MRISDWSSDVCSSDLLLIPKDHGFGLKRVPMEDRYYEAFNQDNVTLVDLLQHPIERITPNGVKTTAQEHQLDVIIYATGFDGIIGSLKRIDIKGRGGKTLKEAWADGPVTYLGLQIPDFPNFFTLIAAHNGATFCNIPRCSEAQVEWLTELLRHALENKIRSEEHTSELQSLMRISYAVFCLKTKQNKVT